MIVQMRTKDQASRVANVTGGTILSDKNNKPTSKVQITDFEAYRSDIENISVLFSLSTDDGDPISSGWTLRGTVFEVEWPREQERRSLIWSHFGARRFAKNWALARIKDDLDKKKNDPAHVSIPWTLQELRRVWNQEKATVAPWWATNSKESYSAGIADMVNGLKNWSDTKKGKRQGGSVRFPRFETKHRSQNRIRFSDKPMRLEPDHRHITIPVIGSLRSKENTRRLERHLTKGNAHVLSMTLSERWGRLFISVQYAARTKIISPTKAISINSDSKAGIDLGMRTLATIADNDNQIFKIDNPAPLKNTLAERRRESRKLSRRIPGSRGHRAARTKLARLDRKAVYIRRETYHQFTRQLVNTYGEIHIEDLNIAAMKRSMGRRAFRRSVSDTALGMFRPMLAYKAEDVGTNVVLVDRFFPSSQIHHECGGLLTGKHKLDEKLTCQSCNTEVNRDENAAKNIRDWPDSNASSGLVEASVLPVPRPPSGGTDGRSDDRLTGRRARPRKTSRNRGRGPERREPKSESQTEEPREGCV